MVVLAAGVFTVMAAVTAGGSGMAGASSSDLTSWAAGAERGSVAAAPTAEPTISRLAGNSRYATSAAISRHEFAPGEASAVYLARGDVFADALVAGALTDGPVLLVPTCAGVPSAVATEIERLDPPVVVALGGVSSLCEDTLLLAANGRPTERVAGADRAQTAALVAQRAFPEGADVVYLARGASSPDPVAGGVLTDGPILLTNNAGTILPPAAAAAIEVLDPTTVIALGGMSSVSSAVLVEAATDRELDRVAGTDRYATSVAIARRAFPEGSARVYLARGDGSNYVDAVAAGVLTDGPVLLTKGPCDWLPPVVRHYLEDTDPTRIVGLGGSSTLCDTVLRQAQRAADTTPPPDCGVLKCVALTFDDGPGPRTVELMNLLIDQHVAATFFEVGVQVDQRPGTAKLLAMEGFSVQNHTWDHPELPPLTRTQQLSQYNRAADELQAAGVPRTHELRPPYGAYDADTRTLGVPLIIWSVDSRDWESRNVGAIHDLVMDTVHSGAIVLQHDVVSQTVDAAPLIIRDLKARGYTFVTVDELVPWAGPGDVVFHRGRVTPAGTPVSPSDLLVLDGYDPDF